VPSNFTVYAGVKLTAADNTPNSAVIVARAPENAGLGDRLFVVAEYKDWTSDYTEVFTWLEKAMQAFLSEPKAATIWLHPDSASYRHTIWQKLQQPVAVFEEDNIAGLTELDWYLSPMEADSVFNPGERDTRLYCLIHDSEQLSAAVDEFGLKNLRQEFQTWGYDKNNEPNAIGAVVDCLRMVTYCFRTVAAPLNRQERVEASLDPQLRAESLAQIPNSPIKDQLLTRRMIEIQTVTRDVEKPVRGAHTTRFARR
jgi:hypothetical protein